MRKAGLLLLFLLLLFPADSETVEYLSMDSSGCVFSFTSTPSFQFLNCTSKLGDSSQWRTCLGRCCPSVQGQLPSMAALELCKLNSPYLGPTLVIVMMIVLLSAFGLLVVLCFFFVLFKVIRAQTSSNRVLPQLTVTQVEWSNENSFNSDIKQLQWSDAAKRERVLPEVGPCAICLEDNTTAQLYCGHQYHPACIGGWLRKSSCCPCCRLANLRGAKVHCRQCRCQYLVCTTILLAQHAVELPKYCPECLLAVRGKNTLVFDDVDQDSRDMFIRSGEMDSHAYFGSQTELAAESFPVLAREEEVVGRAPPTQDLTFIDLSSP